MVDFEKLLKEEGINMNNKEEPIKNFKIGVTEAKKFEIPEIKDGIYDAVLIDLELKVNIPDGKGGTFDQILWNFRVGEQIIQGKTSPIISPMSKAYAWISVLKGEAPKIGTDFNPLSVQGSKCQIAVKHNQKTKSFNGESQTQSIPYISDIFAPK